MRVARRLGIEAPAGSAEAIHYVIGALGGVAYGIAAEWSPAVATAYGSLYGIAVWILGDEVAMPLSGLSAIRVPEPQSPRLAALATHTAYGLTAEEVRRMMRSLVLR